MEKKETSIDNLERTTCNKCFYCWDITLSDYICTKIHKQINEGSTEAEACDLFLDYWIVHDRVEGGWL
jgi:hypothetical protein